MPGPLLERMKTPMNENPLQLLMNPRSIATIGAGNNPMKMGTLHALSILKDGFTGKFYPVHPRDEMVAGHKAYKSVYDLPEVPDLALFVLPADKVPPLLEDFGKIGTKRAIIISAGFREKGPGGEKLEEEITAIARRYGIRFLGPNCIGIINSEISLNTTVMGAKIRPGKLGFASQSGMYVTQALPYLEKRGIKFSKAISVGNEANINLINAFEYLGQDHQTKAIALYIEGIREMPRFLDVARKITPHKPVVALYVGGSGAGARSGKSHVGAMAAPDYLYDGLFRQAGIIRVNSIGELYIFGWMLATQPLPRGKRMGIVTNAGGAGTTIANTVEKGGFEVSKFSDALQNGIKPLIPPHGQTSNPVDVTFDMDMLKLAEKIPKLIMKSGEVDAIILHGAQTSGFIKSIYPHLRDSTDSSLESMLEIFRNDYSRAVSLPFDYGIPMALSTFFGRDDDDVAAAYQDGDIPVFDDPEKVARAMVTLLRYKEITKRKPYVPEDLPAVPKKALEIIELARKNGQESLDEHSAKLVLAAYGIPVSTEKVVSNEEELAKAADEIGYPLVLKVLDPAILHKTEQGFVHLNLKTLDEALSAFRAIRNGAGRKVPVLVAQMVKGEREFLAGAMRYPGFGPCVSFGVGGIFTEALRDTTFRLAPLTDNEGEEMLGDIKAHRLLGAFRGMLAADTKAITSLLKQLSALLLLHPEIAEIDLNPVIISGDKPVVVDALIVLK